MYVAILRDLDKVLSFIFETKEECKMELEKMIDLFGQDFIETTQQRIIKSVTIYKLGADQKVLFKFENNEVII